MNGAYQRDQLIMFRYFKRVAILEINVAQMEASVTFFAFVILISQFLENDMFSNEMDTRM